MSISFMSKGEDGSRFVITLAKDQADTGSVRVQSWPPSAAPGAAPSKDDTNNLYDIRADAAGKRLVCRAKVFGPDPEVTFEIAGTSVSITVAGAILGNGTTSYSLAAEDAKGIREFVVSCQFPALQTTGPAMV